MTRLMIVCGQEWLNSPIRSILVRPGRAKLPNELVLIAVFSEKQSHTVCLLNRQHVTRLDVIN